MRALTAILVAAFCLVSLAACSNAKTPPVGRWEGVFESSDTLVAARLEISPKGEIFLCAPDVTNADATPADARPGIRNRLADDLAAAWGSTEARPMDFDGRVFRKPGGIAPQMEWNPDTKQMTVILYLGARAGLRIPLKPVATFSANPWVS